MDFQRGRAESNGEKRRLISPSRARRVDVDSLGNSNRLRVPRFIQLLHLLPIPLDITPTVSRRVDKVQIDVFQPKLGQALLDGLAGLLLVGARPFRGHPDLLAGETGLFDPLTNLFLVAVRCGQSRSAGRGKERKGRCVRKYGGSRCGCGSIEWGLHCAVSMCSKPRSMAWSIWLGVSSREIPDEP